MATSLNIGDWVQIRAVSYTPQQVGINTYNYVVSSVVGNPTDASVAFAVDTVLAPLMKAFLSNEASYRGVSVQWLAAMGVYPTPSISPVTSIVNDGVGTGGAGLTPTQTALNVSIYAVEAGQAYRGRTYLPFIPLTQVDADGSPTAALLVLARAIGNYTGNTIVATVGGNTATLAPQIYRRQRLAPLPNPVAGRMTPTVRVVVRDKFSTQRRRGQYGKTNSLPF